MKQIHTVLLIVLLGGVYNQVFAWGLTGHKISGAIAADNIKPAVKDSLAVYLGAVPLSEQAAWMETIRVDKAYDHLRPYHYVNVANGQQYDTSSRGNIISELTVVVNELRNRHLYTKEHTAQNLKIVLDLIGDLHQPLNVGYPEDRGGNNVAVNFLGRPSNLHRVWHSDIIEQFGVTYEACSKLAKQLQYEQKKSYNQSDFIGWMNESRQLLPEVYQFKNPTIDAAYCNHNKPVIEKQLAISGLRLAELLNSLF